MALDKRAVNAVLKHFTALGMTREERKTIEPVLRSDAFGALVRISSEGMGITPEEREKERAISYIRAYAKHRRPPEQREIIEKIFPPKESDAPDVVLAKDGPNANDLGKWLMAECSGFKSLVSKKELDPANLGSVIIAHVMNSAHKPAIKKGRYSTVSSDGHRGGRE